MRRLIFSWCLAGLIIISLALVLFYVITGGDALGFLWQRSSGPLFESTARAAVEQFERDGSTLELKDSTGATSTLSIHRIDDSWRTATHSPDVPLALIERAFKTQRLAVRIRGFRLTAACPVTSRSGNSYVAVMSSPSLRRRDFFGRPWFALSRLAAILAIFALVSYGIARQINVPIEQLRAATRRIASGDFSARSNVESINKRAPEIRNLAHDFDVMASRVETLMLAQQRLLRDVSHELRSPLTRMNLSIESARRQVDPAAHGSLDRIAIETDRLNILIEQLLRFSRLESETYVPKLDQPFDCESLLDRIVDDAEFEAAASNRHVELVIAEPGDFEMLGDPELIASALENVIRNAIRFTPEGSAVEVRLEREIASIAVAVSDHGPGVSLNHLASIFEPFYRVQPVNGESAGRGAGLGLAIAKRAIELHGGSIEARNRSESGGSGLVVRISLPCLPALPGPRSVRRRPAFSGQAER